MSSPTRAAEHAGGTGRKILSDSTVPAPALGRLRGVLQRSRGLRFARCAGETAGTVPNRCELINNWEIPSNEGAQESCKRS